MWSIGTMRVCGEGGSERVQGGYCERAREGGEGTVRERGKGGRAL